MPKVNRSRDITAAVRQHTHRIEDRERAIRDPKRTSQEEIIDFCVVGDMEVATSSPCRVRTGGQVVAVNFDADAAGTGSTVFRVLVAGSVVGSSMTATSGTTQAGYYIGNVRVPAGSQLQAEITTAGMHVGAVIQVVLKG